MGAMRMRSRNLLPILKSQMKSDTRLMTDGRGRHTNHPRGSAHGRWNRELMISSTGYVKIRVGLAHPLADSTGYCYERLLVWVSAGNRRPGKGEVLHNRSGDKLDSRLENMLLITRAQLNVEKNKAQMRDPCGRVMSALATRLVRGGAVLRTERLKT